MNEKQISTLALWSWILPVLGQGFAVVILLFFSDVTYFGPILPDPTLIVIIIWATTLLGLIFGIIALRKISRNSELTGKTHAIVGIILNAVFILLSALFNLYRL